MRKLKLQVQMSIDGFIAGSKGEMDWLTLNWSQDIMDYVTGLTQQVDTILLGSNLARGFIPHWMAALNKPEPEPGADIFVNTPKLVFTKTLKDSDPEVKSWANTTLVRGDLVQEVTSLKKQKGKDMIAYGGGKFVSALLKEKLIDELHLFVNPAVLGSGMAIFADIVIKQNYQLLNVTPFACGIVVLTYKPL